jgi:hypothetical protein
LPVALGVEADVAKHRQTDASDHNGHGGVPNFLKALGTIGQVTLCARWHQTIEQFQIIGTCS